MEAGQYLEHRYETTGNVSFPVPDEGFVSMWEKWFEGDFEGDFPENLKEALRADSVRRWIEATPAGRIPVIYSTERSGFERICAILGANESQSPLPASVNAFTMRPKNPAFAGHRVILLGRSGYSGLLGESVGVAEDEWLEKSMLIRLHHECCHYFTLRVMGGMKNHALDEVVADCVGQLAAFCAYSARMQRKFFGISGGEIEPGARLRYYIKTLSEGAVPLVLDRLEAAMESLEAWLAKNGALTAQTNRPELIAALASLGLNGIAALR
jgi:hypothetical protein